MKYNYICETMDVIYWFAVSGEHQWMFGNVVRNGTPWYTQNPITPSLLGHCLLHASMASHWVNEVWFLLLGLPTEGLKSICYVYIYLHMFAIHGYEWRNGAIHILRCLKGHPALGFPRGLPISLDWTSSTTKNCSKLSSPSLHLWPNKHVVNMLSPPILRQNGCHCPCFIQSVFLGYEGCWGIGKLCAAFVGHVRWRFRL